MANRDTTITLDQVHDGIVAAIQAKFPTLQTVECYREDRKSLPTPACLVELTEMEAPEDDPGTEQLAMLATFEALLVMRPRGTGINPKLEIRRMAAAFAAFARLQRWGCPVGPAKVLAAHPSDFEPELDQYEVWRVEWQQVLHLGETVWTDTGTQPTEVLAGQVPLVGPAYVDEYQQVNQ